MSRPLYTLNNTQYRLVCDGCHRETPIETALIFYREGAPGHFMTAGLCGACALRHREALTAEENGYCGGWPPTDPRVLSRKDLP